MLPLRFQVTEEYRGVEDELKNDLYADQDSIISVGHTDPNALVDNEVTVSWPLALSRRRNSEESEEIMGPR